jgi:hypothetical protein
VALLPVLAFAFAGASAGSCVTDLADDCAFVLRPELFDFDFLCHS